MSEKIHDEDSRLNKLDTSTTPMATGENPEEKLVAAPSKPKVERKIGYMELFKFSSKWEKTQIILGIVLSMLNGVLQPTYGLIIRNIVEMFDPSITDDKKSEMMHDSIAMMAILSIATFAAAYGGFAFMQISSEKLSFKLRARYLASLMKQEVEYFETQQIEALPSKMAEYFTHIAEGSGEKCG